MYCGTEQNSVRGNRKKLHTFGTLGPVILGAISALIVALLFLWISGRLGAPEKSVKPFESQNAETSLPSAVDVIERIEVKSLEPFTGYNRSKFGEAWIDVDKNGCNTRQDILRRDLRKIIYANNYDCRIDSGILYDPYTGKTVNYKRGPKTSEAVQIDHVVALANAWRTGAQHWNLIKRTQLANDPINLIAVDGEANQLKGSQDASSWLPSNRKFRCEYVARQIAVKARYGLFVTKNEKESMQKVLLNCSEQLLPETP